MEKKKQIGRKKDYRSGKVLYGNRILCSRGSGKNTKKGKKHCDALFDCNKKVIFDANGKKIKVLLYDADGSLMFQNIYKYDTRGNNSG